MWKKGNILWAALVIPLQGSPEWTELQFSKIPANKVTFLDKEITIEVASSASPLIYRLPKPTQIAGFEAEIDIQGELNLPKKGNSFEEDSYIRFGFVASGENTLGGFKKMFAADWVKKMFALAPSGMGLDKIYFFNVATSSDLMGKSRLHPRSEYMFEEVVAIRTPDQKKVLISKKFAAAKEVMALWLSADGDDSKSKFTLQLRSLQLTEAL